MIFTGRKIICFLNYNNKQYTYEIERHKTINDLYNLFLADEPKIDFPIMIRLDTNKYPFIKKDFDTPLLSLLKEKEEKLIFEVTKTFICTSCSSLNNELNNNIKEIKNNENNVISKYCLKCNKYLCNLCIKKSNSLHNNHKLIDINPNDLKNSVKLWCINLIADLSNQIISFKIQNEFMNENDFLTKAELWKNNIIAKINRFENLINNIFEKLQNFRKLYQNKENIYNKIMQNLMTCEKEINEELFFERDKKYAISFEEAEEQIQKLKNNYEEIEKIKKEIKPIIDANNIRAMEKNMNNIPISFDQLTESTLLIEENIKNFENIYNNDDLEKIYKYPNFLNYQKNYKSHINSSSKTLRTKKKRNNYLISKKPQIQNKRYIISHNELNFNNKILNTNNNNNNGFGKLITQITKLSDIPASYSIVEYSKYMKNNENITPVNLLKSDSSNIKNIKFLNLKGIENTKDIINEENLYNKEGNNNLTLPKTIDIDKKFSNNDNKKVSISEKLFSSMDNKYKRNKKY